VAEVLRGALPLHTQSQEKTEVIPIFLGQQPQEKAIDEVRDAEEGNSEAEQALTPGKRTHGKRTHEGEVENIGSHTQSPNVELPVKS
jgi:hypothetical protein